MGRRWLSTEELEQRRLLVAWVEPGQAEEDYLDACLSKTERGIASRIAYRECD